MNPLTNMKNVLKLSELELKNAGGAKSSWHDMYRGSAWIFVGGFPYTLTEGDIICIFSQYGEIVNINLVRDKETGKSKGFCFVCYEDQRSTVLAVDNLNGIKILDRTLRVDHVSDYKPPKENEKMDEETLRLYMEGCAPKPQMEGFVKQEKTNSDTEHQQVSKHKHRKMKAKKHKERKSKKSKKKKRVKKYSSSESLSSSSDSDVDTRRRKKKPK